MRKSSYLIQAIILVILAGAASISAQNMSNTVVTKEIKLARGQSQSTVRGKADYGMSYVFEVAAKSGQKMDITLAGNHSDLTFSLVLPDEETLEDAFNTSKWSGKLPQTGKYSIVVIMNDEFAKKVPYSLTVRIK